MQLYEIDFENIYLEQTWHHLYQKQITKLNTEKIQGVNSYCSREAEKFLLTACSKLHMPAITFLGSGNYHYLSYLLLQQIKQPFSLILFDFHSDMQTGLCRTTLSCGNWVDFALKKCRNLKQVFLIGISKQYIPASPVSYKKDLFFFPEDELQNNNWLHKLDEKIRFPLYISIDKDVFNSNLVHTNWDQGSMNEEMIQTFFRSIHSRYEILGGDICGEHPINYTVMIRKKTAD